ncbi:MAG: fibronectin type III domain-containing protein [Cyclobacteriaceae bacterium]|nr:fibronectin type III domain-containing protein [Cyclobacteriaceae bacterium HetDA_MAG_MS6]
MKNQTKTNRVFGHILKTLMVFVGALTSHGLSAQDNFIVPEGANVYIVTEAPFNADNTGATDATAAIQAALDSAGTVRNSDRFNFIYFPNGTYLISDELRWAGARTRDIFQGQSRDGVIIKLTDSNPLYQDVSISKGMVYTGDFQTPSVGANRFRNGIYNMTFDVGSGNPGATGVRYYANNQGRMENVLIKSTTSVGKIGLDLGFSQDNGPLLIKGVTIEGFDIGISIDGVVNSITLKDINLTGQNNTALLNNNQVVSIENLNVTGDVVGILNQGAAMLAIINSTFTGTGAASGIAAISNSNGLFARDITTTGYLQAVDNSGAGTGILTADQNITEFSSHEVLSLFSSPSQSLNLPIKQAPEIALADTSDWVSLTDFAPVDTTIGSTTFTNWAPALQQAIDAGKSTVFLPAGSYKMVGDVFVRGDVERIIGMETKVERQGSDFMRLVVEEGSSPNVLIERFNAIGARIRVVQSSSRTLIVKSMECGVDVEPFSGDVFIEDVVDSDIVVEQGNHVWARQLDMESSTNTKVVNRGADVWVLGLKTEQDANICETTQNGRTEIIGGLIFANGRDIPEKIMFDIEEGSQVSFSIGEFVLREQPFNTVRETRDGFTRFLTADDTPGRGGGALVTLYTGYRAEATSLPNAPTNLSGQVLRYDQIVLDWEDNSTNEDGFILQRKVESGTFEDLDVAFADQISFNDSTLSPSTLYTYRVKSTNSFGQSAFSNEFSATTLPAPPAPAPASNLSFQLAGGIYEFSWDDNSTGESGFRLERRALQDESAFQVRAVLPENSTSFRDSLYLGFTDYEYRVVSFFEISDAAPSDTASFTSGKAVDAVIEWSYEETTGTVAQDGGFLDRDGELLNGLTFDSAGVAGVFGRGIRLDGDEHLIRYDLGNIINDIDDYPFTLSTWVRTTSNDNQTAAYFGGSTLFDLYYTISVINGKPRAVVRRLSSSTEVVQGTDIADGKWHQLVAVFAAENRFELYQDGQFVGASDSTNVRKFVTQAYNFSAGALDRFRGSGNDPDANPTDPFDGSLDETKLYYRVLNPREILAEYQAAQTGTPPASPTSLIAANTNPGEVTLQWTDNSGGLADFIIERKRDTDTTFTIVGELGLGATDFVDQGLNGFTEYTYRVKAVRGLLESDFSNEAVIITGETLGGLKIRWTLNDTSGSVATDISDNGFDGGLSSGMTFDSNGTDGILEGALNFDGNDKVTMSDPSFFDFGYPFTMSAWVRTTGPGGRVFLFLGDKGRNDVWYALRTSFGTSGKVRIEARRINSSASLNSNTVIQDGEWHLVTGVFESATRHDLYVDGVFDSSLNSGINFRSSINRFSAGALDRQSTADRYEGDLDDVRFYDRALSPAEVQNLYNRGFVPKAPTDLVVTVPADSTLSLTWTDNAIDELGYVVERREVGGFFTVVDSLSPDAAAYTDTGLKPSRQYYYRVAAFNAFGNSDYSNEDSARTTDVTIPPAEIAKYAFGVDSLASSDTDTFSTASDFVDGPGLAGGTFYFYGLRGVNQSVLTKDLEDAIAEEDYFEFTVTPEEGLNTNLSELSFYAKRTFGGPNKVAIQNSVDSFSTSQVERIYYFWSHVELDLSDSVYQGIAEPITFRILPHGRKSSPWFLFFKNFLIDHVSLEAGFTTGSGGSGAGGNNARLAGIEEVVQEQVEDLPTRGALMYPNPAVDQVNLRLTKALESQGLIRVYDMEGRLVISEDVPESTGNYVLNVSKLESGLFLVKLTSAQQTQQFRLIKK